MLGSITEYDKLIIKTRCKKLRVFLLAMSSTSENNDMLIKTPLDLNTSGLIYRKCKLLFSINNRCTTYTHKMPYGSLKIFKLNSNSDKRFVVAYKWNIANRKRFVINEIFCHPKNGLGLIFIDYWIWFVRRKIVSYLQKRIITIINLNWRKLTIRDLNGLM